MGQGVFIKVRWLDGANFPQCTRLTADVLEDGVQIGSVKGYLVRTEDMHPHAVFDMFDSHDQGLCDVYESIVRAGSSMLLPTFQKHGFRMGDLKLLYIEELALLPSHRGRDLGLSVLSAFMRVVHMMRDMLVILRPAPIDPSGFAWFSGKDPHAFEIDAPGATTLARWEAGVKKLHRHYAKAGFVAYGRDKDYMYLTFGAKNPSAPGLRWLDGGIPVDLSEALPDESGGAG